MAAGTETAKKPDEPAHDPPPGHGGDDDKGKDIVEIKVNGDPVKIHRGAQTGLAIKTAAGCPSTFVLEQLPGLEEIPNDKRITIKGLEEFVCHQPVGQQS